jgi:hypothetical protein
VGTVALALFAAGVLVMCALFSVSAEPTPVDPERPPPPLPPPLPPSGAGTEEAWSGTCIEVNDERDRATFYAYRNSGSARRLRGKIALLHIRLDTADRTLSKTSITRVESAAIAAKEFYMRQARAHGIAPLDIDLVPWKLDTPVNLPALRLDRLNAVDPATRDRVRAAARLAIETALNSTLEAIVARYRKDGYDEVGFFVYLPVVTPARAFAWFAVSQSSRDFADVGYVFAENHQLGELASIVSHEGLHLFGGDDLYRVVPRDPGDAKDLMNDVCSGLGQAKIGEATAYAIGWQPTRPVRRYTIVDQ